MLSLESESGDSAMPCDSGNTSSLGLNENQIQHSEQLLWTGTETVSQLETAIHKCKENILSLGEMSEEKRLLVQNLVKLRLRLQDVQEIEIYTDPKKVKVIHCHKFVQQSVVQLKFKTSQLYCETCVHRIWIPIQSWFCCSGKKYCIKLDKINDLTISFFYESECEYISHGQCLNSVKRICASLKVNENPEYTMEICPEIKLGIQNYRCFECKSGISFSKHIFLLKILFMLLALLYYY